MRYIVIVRQVEEPKPRRLLFQDLALMLAFMMRIAFVAGIGVVLLIVASAG